MTGPLEIEYAKRGTSVNGERGICTRHGTGRLHERGAEVTNTPHIPKYDASGDLWRGGDTQHEILTGKNTVASSEKHTQATNRTGGKI